MKVITIARKPFSGTVAHNMLTHGCSGLNINACRIKQGEQPSPTSAPGWDSYNKTNSEQGYRPSDYEQGDASYAPSNLGRWPANTVFRHLDGCQCEGTKKVKGITGGSHSGVAQTHEVGAKLKRHNISRHNDPEGNETVANWICAEGCPIPVLDNQSGIVPTGSWNRQKDGAHPFGDAAGSEYDSWKVVNEPEGGASRFFKVVK